MKLAFIGLGAMGKPMSERLIDNGYELKSISISPTLPSINEPNEVEIVKEYVLKDRYQQRIINQILELN